MMLHPVTRIFLLFCYVAHSVVYLEMDGITDTSYLTKHWTYGSLGLHNSSPPCWEGRHSLDCCLHAAIGTEKEDGISQETQHVRTSIDRGQPPVMSGGRLICLHITTPSGFPAHTQPGSTSRIHRLTFDLRFISGKHFEKYHQVMSVY